MQKVNEDEKVLILRLIQALEQFRSLDEEMPVQTMLTFLYGAKDQGINMTGLMNAASLKQSSASRNIQAWSDMNRHGDPGWGMVDHREDPAVSRREKVVELTQKGRGFLTRLLKPLMR